MASYFYIVPFKNKSFFKLGISSGTKENLLNRFNQHRNGFESEGIEIDVEKIEYIEFKNSVAAGFIEREMKKTYTCSKICNYGSTEVFNLELLPAVKNEVAQFSLNYGGTDFKNHEKTPRARALKKILSDDEQRLKNERVIQSNIEYNKRLNQQLESENIQIFNAFSKWFEKNKNHITSIDSNQHIICIDMDLRGLEIGHHLIYHLEDGSFNSDCWRPTYSATIWEGSELVCYLDGTYDNFSSLHSHHFIDPGHGWFQFHTEEFLKIYNSRPDLWVLLPVDLRNVVLNQNGL